MTKKIYNLLDFLFIFLLIHNNSVWWHLKTSTGSSLSHNPCLWPLTFAVLQHRLHGTLPLRVPAHLCRAGALLVFRLPALPQVHLHTVIQHEESWKKGKNIWALFPYKGTEPGSGDLCGGTGNNSGNLALYLYLRIARN